MSAAGVYADHVAEHAVAGLLAAVHRLIQHAHQDRWSPIGYRPLTQRTVAVVGGGGIGTAAMHRLVTLGATVLAVTRTGQPVEAAHETVATAHAREVWRRVDDIVLAVPATPATRHFVDEAALRALPTDGCVVNVGRGEAIDTAALLRVLDDGHLGGAVLDVTDPEPLPVDHPLWTHHRVIVSSHSANPTSLRWPALARRVAENLTRIAAGAQPTGVIEDGY
ncbi:NAD(P)-dependent oxidoreductase [Cellulomonas fimi]|nr:NAD(P)-dependent oxidoreductase [Cellulomonas fimi]